MKHKFFIRQMGYIAIVFNSFLAILIIALNIVNGKIGDIPTFIEITCYFLIGGNIGSAITAFIHDKMNKMGTKKLLDSMYSHMKSIRYQIVVIRKNLDQNNSNYEADVNMINELHKQYRMFKNEYNKTKEDL